MLKQGLKTIVFLMIAIILVAGIVSCGGAEDISGSRGGGNVENPITLEPDPDPEPEPTPDDGKWNLGETEGKEFYGSSYRTLFVPWSPERWYRVSYNDTDRLDRFWKALIDNQIKDGQRRMYIKTRDGDLFFDENYNIRWSKKPETVLKWFQGGVIAQLREGYGNNEQSAAEEQIGSVRFSGYYTIGGLYTFAMSLREASAEFNSDSINEFFWARSKDVAKNNGDFCFGGRMDVLVVHPGYPVNLETGKYFPYKNWNGTGYAAQLYTSWGNLGYDDGNHYLYNIKGNTPERYMPGLNRTHQIYHLYFRWALDKVYNPNSFSSATESADNSARITIKKTDLTSLKFK